MTDSTTHQHKIPELDTAGLRSFGLVTGLIVVLIFAGFFPWLLDLGLIIWPWVVAAALWVPALLFPDSLRIVYKVWMRFGLVMSRITTPIILGTVFYLVIFPIGLIMKAISRDPMKRKFDNEAGSYRVTSVKSERTQIKRPY